MFSDVSGRAQETFFLPPVFSSQPEIRDAAWRADPGSGHHHHPLVLPIPEAPGNVLQSQLHYRRTPTSSEESSAAPPPGRVCVSVSDQAQQKTTPKNAEIWKKRNVETV